MIQVHDLGLQDYSSVWQKMRAWVDSDEPDQIWSVEHPPVYTQGQAGKAEHLLFPGNIPVIQTDRGGQVTYHGPGQRILYPLIDIKRANIGVRDLITALEQSVVDLLAHRGLYANARRRAPGVYVGASKVSSLGLRVRKGRSFHGIALNADMDLTPFSGINPCGYAQMPIVDLKRLGVSGTDLIADKWAAHLIRHLRSLGY